MANYPGIDNIVLLDVEIKILRGSNERKTRGSNSKKRRKLFRVVFTGSSKSRISRYKIRNPRVYCAPALVVQNSKENLRVLLRRS